MKRVKLIDYQGDLKDYIHFGIQNAPCFMYKKLTKEHVFIASDKLCDVEYLKEANIDYTEISSTGSTIVASEGDIELAIFANPDYCSNVYSKLIELLSRKVNNGKIQSNDFVYDNKKYAGYTEGVFGEIVYFGVHISNNINQDLIDKVCTKNSTKIPTALENKVSVSDIINLYNEVENENR